MKIPKDAPVEDAEIDPDMTIVDGSATLGSPITGKDSFSIVKKMQAYLTALQELAAMRADDSAVASHSRQKSCSITLEDIPYEEQLQQLEMYLVSTARKVTQALDESREYISGLQAAVRAEKSARIRADRVHLANSHRLAVAVSALSDVQQRVEFLSSELEKEQRRSREAVHELELTRRSLSVSQMELQWHTKDRHVKAAVSRTPELGPRATPVWSDTRLRVHTSPDESLLMLDSKSVSALQKGASSTRSSITEPDLSPHTSPLVPASDDLTTLEDLSL